MLDAVFAITEESDILCFSLFVFDITSTAFLFVRLLAVVVCCIDSETFPLDFNNLISPFRLSTSALCF